MLTSDEVMWGYRYILDREPESSTTIKHHMSTYGSWREFRSALLNCAEYSQKSCGHQVVSKWVAAEIFGGKRLIWLDLADDYVSRGCLFDSYETVESELVRKYLKPGQVFLDIGANIGWFTLLASTIVGKTGHVHAFEPRRPTVDYLRRSIKANRLEGLVTLYDFGLDRESAKRNLGWVKDTNNPGSSALIEDPKVNNFDVIPIEVAALDALKISRVDFIKIDVEGAEMRVLEGGAATIESNRPIVLSEIIPASLKRISGTTSYDYFSWFSNKGYRAFIADHERNGEEISDFPSDWGKELMNVIFIPSL